MLTQSPRDVSVELHPGRLDADGLGESRTMVDGRTRVRTASHMTQAVQLWQQLTYGMPADEG